MPHRHFAQVREYAKDPEGMKKLMEEYKDKINLSS